MNQPAASPEGQEDALLAFLKRQGYLDARYLPDGSCAALVKLGFTTAVITGVSFSGYASRFCFEDRATAWEQYLSLQSQDDVPEGWIARR